MTKVKLEIACNSFQSCLNAQLGGADRIELFENILEGGCTPSYGLIKLVKEKLNIPIYVMIRPRGGNFNYSDEEFDIMKTDIKICQELKVDGVVFGILNHHNEIDIKRNNTLINLCKIPATFHRAFDRTNDLISSAEEIIKIGFERILTSGGKMNVDEGKNNILQLQKMFDDKIIVMPGCGVTPKNAKKIIDFTGTSEIHSTAKSEIKTQNKLFNDSSFVTNIEIVKKIKSAITF
jgi:copper homeostasis protein